MTTHRVGATMMTGHASAAPMGEVRDKSIVDLVSAAAATAPTAPAVCSDRTARTYTELATASDLLAQKLGALGVGPDVPVGVCLKRSFQQIVALLGSWKAGGAFVPLDPVWPTERICKLLDDSGAPVVLAEPDLCERLSDAARIALRVDDEAATVSCDRTTMKCTSDNLAYVIYTSGSTGDPKGVEITHRNLMNLVLWHRENFAVTSRDRASCIAGLGFDATIWEVWPYLAAGACVCLSDDETRRSPSLLRDWLVAQGITMAFVPTALAEQMIQDEWPTGSALRMMLTGGEQLHRRPPPDLPFPLINNYGPTECTVVTTSETVAAAGGDGVPPSIGRAIRNVQIHILDQRGQPIPDGEIGEIYVAGEGVGRGYRNCPELTARHFVRYQLDDGKTPTRVFRTGDLGRKLPDGRIAFCGRLDDQVKIRGYRVEPGEVVAALNRHPNVAQSAVVARNGELAAYIVSAGGREPTARELKKFLAKSLPDYMHPSRFARLASLPLTSSGKVDRAALLELGPIHMMRDAAYRAPRTVTEQRLAEMMADLLKIEKVGADDNFFLLGGHSLLGSQLVLRVREAFGVELTLRNLFEAPNVSALAATVEHMVVDMVSKMNETDAQVLARAW